jgi:hypothetical protein
MPSWRSCGCNLACELLPLPMFFFNPGILFYLTTVTLCKAAFSTEISPKHAPPERSVQRQPISAKFSPESSPELDSSSHDLPFCDMLEV